MESEPVAEREVKEDLWRANFIWNNLFSASQSKQNPKEI